MNRGTLKKLAQQGRLVSIGSSHFDDMTGSERRTTELPVRIRAGTNDHSSGSRERGEI